MSSNTYEWRLVGTSLSAASTDRILPVISSHFYFVLNEAGTGEVTIPLDSVAAGIVTEGMLVVLYYRGAIRGSFLVENIRKVPASTQDGAGEVLSIMGSGGMSVLDRAIIWGDGTTSTTRTFTSVTKASILVTLVTEAQARSGLSTLTLDFDAVNDSDSVAWTDSETYKLNVGTSLLDLVRQFAKTGIDFEVTYSGTGFVLSAYKNGIGTDKSETVFFRAGTNCQEIDIDQRGNDIKNALLVAYQSGQIVVTDSTSITANGRREELLDARLAQTAASATTYGAAILDTVKDTKIGRTINVYDGVPPYLFVNYILGDTVTLDIEGTETTDRILGIQCNFDNGEYSNVVIELNSLMLEQNLRMQQDIDYLLNNWQTAHDAGLLEVSYWAAIGNDDFAFEPGTINSFGRFLSMHKIGDVIYFAETNTGRITSYSITSGQWELITAALTYPHCMTSIGTDLYIGGYGAWKIDTTTNTLTTIGTVLPSSSPVGRILAAAVIGTDVYFGGAFSDVDGVASVNFIRYNSVADTWHACGSGATGRINAMLAVGSEIYLGGSGLTAINGVAVSFVGKWNGTTGVALGAGLGDDVYTLVAYGTNVLAGGAFTGGISEWNGTSWATFGGGITGDVHGLAVYLTDVFAIGAFTDVGNYIARYSGGTWWELGTGLNNYAGDIVLNDDDIYVVGIFTTAGDKDALYVAAYFNNFESLVDYLENSSSSFNMGAAIHAATASTISDSDEVPFWEDVANALRKITWANIKATLKTYFDTLYVALTGNQTIAGVKTFSSFPITPSSAPTADYEVANKKYIDDNNNPAGSNLQVQINNSGAFGADDEFEYTLGGQIISLGRDAGAEASAVWSWQTGGVSFHNLASWGTGNYSSMRGILARGTKASPTAAQADDIAMRFRGSAYDGVGLVLSSATGAEIRFVANENQSATNHGMRAEIWTTPDGSTTETKVFTIGADGQVAVLSTTEISGGGTTASPYVTGGALIVSGAVSVAKRLMVGTNGANGQFIFNGGAGFVRDLLFTTDGINRWIARVNATAESGSNAGSDFDMIARADDGSSIGTVYTITRSTRKFNFSVTTDSTSSTTGAVIFGGGVGIAKALYVGTSILSAGATAGIGYTTGAGGTVTQATNKTTGVTLNKATGLITMNNAALAADTTVTFTLTNSAIAATDTIILNHASAGTAGAYTLNAQVAAGSATINVRNVTAGSLSEAIVIRYTVIKSVSA